MKVTVADPILKDLFCNWENNINNLDDETLVKNWSKRLIGNDFENLKITLGVIQI